MVAFMTSNKQKVVRWIFAGPISVIGAVLVMMGMAVWFPKGRAGIDNIILPLVLFPLLWVGMFLYASLDRSLPRMVAVMLSLLAIHAGIIAWHFSLNGGG